MDQAVVDDRAADLLVQLVQRLHLVHRDCRSTTHHALLVSTKSIDIQTLLRSSSEQPTNGAAAAAAPARHELNRSFCCCRARRGSGSTHMRSRTRALRDPSRRAPRTASTTRSPWRRCRVRRRRPAGPEPANLSNVVWCGGGRPDGEEEGTGSHGGPVLRSASALLICPRPSRAEDLAPQRA